MNSTTKCRFLFPFHEVHFFDAFNISIKQLFGEKKPDFSYSTLNGECCDKSWFFEKKMLNVCRPPCRGLSAEEEVVLLHLLDVKMFLKKQELKERMTSARKKSLGSVSSLSQALLYPSICQV